MNRKNALTLALGAVVLAFGSAAQAVPVFADSFDANVLGLNAVPTGWSVSDGTVDIIGNNFSGTSFDLLPGHGAYIDLDGSTANSGLLFTTLNLTGGTQYTAAFDLAGSQRGGQESGTVSFGSSLLNYSLASAAGFSAYTMSFTPATTGQYLLAFQNADGNNIGALLDNVAVTAAVPEPGTYALLAAGLLAIGFVSRRRKNAA